MEEITILTKSQLEKVISNAIQRVVTTQQEVTKEGEQKRWLTNKEVSEMLSVTPRTLQNLRDKGEIGFSKVGSKIYYKQSDLNAFLESHYHKAFNAGRRVRS